MPRPLASRDAQLARRPKLTRRVMSNSNTRNQRSPHLAAGSSPLISALQGPSDLLSRSIPFSPFRAAPSPPGAPNSVGSTTGGVGLNGGPSSPPSAPTSYSSAGGGGFNASRQVKGYEDHGSVPYGGFGGFYASSQRSAGGTLNVGANFQPNQNNYASALATIDELGLVGGNVRVAGGNGASGGDNVVISGWDGGVDVWRIGRNTTEQIARLDGVRGSVMGAKV